MCGRTACTLEPGQLARAARYRNAKGKEVSPRWKDGDQNKYQPSYNKAPMSYCPILIHSQHFCKGEEYTNDERVIVSMKWGLVPSWVKDASSTPQYKMNNARSDTMLSKASYRRPLEKGQRCVVLADGFYEWNTTKSGKQPYYIYFKDDEPGGKKLVTMAGIFERREEDGHETFSFSVITVDAHSEFSWLHHRMPAMLENEDEVRRWLDFGSVPLKEANNLIKPKSCLAWHPVATTVNNSRNNQPEHSAKVSGRVEIAAPASQIIKNHTAPGSQMRPIKLELHKNVDVNIPGVKLQRRPSIILQSFGRILPQEGSATTLPPAMSGSLLNGPTASEIFTTRCVQLTLFIRSFHIPQRSPAVSKSQLQLVKRRSIRARTGKNESLLCTKSSRAIRRVCRPGRMSCCNVDWSSGPSSHT